MLSVNQINAQIKLTENWKAVNHVECPLKITKIKDVLSGRKLRSKNESENNLLETGYTVVSIGLFWVFFMPFCTMYFLIHKSVFFA